ncbi:hypothetical protein [Almyronema epifaneia]|uniref:Uncharacterized protein n=1 Tax=Almyronema epifaneia S1 TaxID=2991925 RepID=A0ABW6IJ64_9CYAN
MKRLLLLLPLFLGLMVTTVACGNTTTPEDPTLDESVDEAPMEDGAVDETPMEEGEMEGEETEGETTE